MIAGHLGMGRPRAGVSRDGTERPTEGPRELRGGVRRAGTGR
jgi:hypothetical protein